MARKGKRERIIAARQSIMTANCNEQKDQPLLTKGIGPAGYKSRSTDNRTGLKGRNSGVGFHGPRGFNSPVYAVSKREQTKGLIGPVAGPDKARPAFGVNGSQRFAGDEKWAAEEFGYDYAVPEPSDTILMKHPPKRPRWRKV